MKAAVYYSNDDVRIEERAIPEIGTDEIRVRIHAAGICGSDLLEWYRKPRAPLVLGHELAGEVDEAGADVTTFNPGDRVILTHHVPCGRCRPCRRGHPSTCDTLRSTTLDPGGFVELTRVPAAQTRVGVLPIPEGLSYEEAALSEPAGCALHGLARGRFEPDQTLLVLGCGGAGAMVVLAARALGGDRVLVTDKDEHRLALAEKLGAARAISADDDVPARVREATDGRGADLVAICTDALAAMQQGFSAVGRGGTILFFAPVAPGVEVPVPLFPLWRDDVTLTTSYAASPEDLESALEHIADGTIPVAKLITDRLPLVEAESGFRIAAGGGKSVKVILLPQSAAS